MAADPITATTGTVTRDELSGLKPLQIRRLIREGRWKGGTEGLARGYAQANLIILPKDVAFEFLVFCQRNQRPCPVLEVTDVGQPLVKYMADADLRTDLPYYTVYKNGEAIADPSDITNYWRDDLVGFLIGCSYSFEQALLNAGIPLRHQDENKIVSVYKSNIQCASSGRFAGPMVVSMRPIKRDQVTRAVQITSRFPATHGAPVHIGDPSLIGVDLSRPDFGTASFELEKDDVPVFWACGGTPQAVAQSAKIDFMITHKIGYLLITDKLSESIAAL